MIFLVAWQRCFRGRTELGVAVWSQRIRDRRLAGMPGAWRERSTALARPELPRWLLGPDNLGANPGTLLVAAARSLLAREPCRSRAVPCRKP